MSAGKAVLIQFDWDQMRVVSTQVVEQTHPGQDVFADAQHLATRLRAESRGCGYAILGNDEATSAHQVTKVTMLRDHGPRVAELAARQNPWAAERMAD